MLYVTNPYLILHHIAAVARQIIKTTEMCWNQEPEALDQRFEHTTAATTTQLKAEGHFLLSGLAHKHTLQPS